MTELLGISSLIVAAVALWVAWDVRVKSTQHVLRLLEVSSGYQESVEHPKGFHYFDIYFKNLGLAIPRMSVSLGFRERNGKGWLSYPLDAIDIPTGKSARTATEVTCGLVVRFGLRSNKMDDHDCHFLRTLEDLSKQEASLTVYCSGYRVWTITVASWMGRVKAVLWRAEHAAWRGLGLGAYAKNQDSWRARFGLPKSRLVSFHLNQFIRGLPEKDGTGQAGKPMEA